MVHLGLILLRLVITITILLSLVRGDDSNNSDVSDSDGSVWKVLDATVKTMTLVQSDHLVLAALRTTAATASELMKKVDSMGTLIFEIADILTNAVLSYIYPHHLEDIRSIVKEAPSFAHNNYLTSVVAVTEIKDASKLSGKSSQNVDKIADLFLREMEKTRRVLTDMTELQEQTHQEAMQSMHGIQEDIRTASKAASIIANVLVPANSLDVELFIKQLKIFYARAKNLDYLFLNYQTCVKMFEKYNKDTLNIFIAKCMNVQIMDEYDLRNTLDMQNLLTDPNEGIFSLIDNEMVQKYILTTRRISSLQFLHNTFSYVILTEIRTMFVVDFAYQLSYFINPNSTYDQEYTNYTFYTGLRVNWIIEAFKYASRKLNGSQWVYDTYKNKIGNEYVLFTNFMKGIVYRDTDCKYAGNFVNGNNQRKQCQLENIHDCSGTIHCDSDTSSANMYICYSNNSLKRRYDYVFLESDQPSLKCSGKKVIYDRKENCRNCLCYCDEPDSNYTERFISLDEMVTNTTDLKVVTGVRLSKYGGVIGMDIRESQLDSTGYFRKQSSNWIINKGNRYFKLTYPDKRYIHVGEIINIDEDRIVTGVRFVETKYGVELQTRVHEYVTCLNKTCLTKTQVWVSGASYNYNSDIVDLTGLDVPTAAAEKGVFTIESFTHKRIQVSPSGFNHDGAQSVLPFFDIRPIYTVPPAMLRGIALAYKSANPMYGGYIVPYLIVADFSSRINSEAIKLKLLNIRSNLVSKTTTISAENVIITINYLILFILF